MSTPAGATTSPMPDADHQGADGRIRASDAEREEAVATLHRALSAGRLDLADAEARVGAAYAARYRSDLPPLLADLPQEPSSTDSEPPTWTAVWASIAWRARRVRRPVVLLVAAMVALGGVSGAAGMALGVAVSEHHTSHFRPGDGSWMQQDRDPAPPGSTVPR